MSVMAAPSAEPRARLYRALSRRNRMVAALRIILPILGVVGLVVVAGAIILDHLSSRFSISGIKIDRENLVVDTPELSSTLADGTTVTLEAQSAHILTTDSDKVALSTVKFASALANGPHLAAKAANAQLTLSRQLVDVPGTTEFTSSDGGHGTAEQLKVDVLGLKISTAGAVDFQFGDGNRLSAADMAYDHKTGTWVFHKVNLWISSTPGE